MVSNTIYWEIFLLSQSIGVSQKAFFSRHIFIVKKIYINEWLQKNNPLLYLVLEKKKKRPLMASINDCMQQDCTVASG